MEDNALSASWKSLTGVCRRWKIRVPEGETAAVTYTVEDPGEGFAVALLLEDGSVQRLREGENQVPGGVSVIAFGGLDGTGRAFQIQADGKGSAVLSD